MPFLVISPGLAPGGRRNRLAQSTLYAFDRTVHHAERRMRASHAAVWQLPQHTAAERRAMLADIESLRDAQQVDMAMLDQPYRWSDFSVLAMDMDSTVITIECIDEIADYCGKKADVAAITDAAMRGEIKDYADSLRRRVALLEGLSETVLQDVIRYRLKFTPGVKELVDAANKAGLHTLLVSGGFTQFTDFVSEKIGFQQTRSNTLEIRDGKLTGKVVGEIVDATVKQKTVAAACRALGVTSKKAITVGDGANDLKMMMASGLSIAHRAKPAVAAQAMQAIRFGGLDNVLDWFD
jgi:phosphoserine phosphatase